MAYEFMGYERENGTVGVRNKVIVLSAGKCSNELTARISDNVRFAEPLLNNSSCLIVESDKDRHFRAMVGLGRNPNVGAMLIVGVGCDGIRAERLYDAIRQYTSNVEFVAIGSDGDFDQTVRSGSEICFNMVQKAAEATRSPAGLDRLQLALKCGGSDTTSPMGCNAVAGYASDIIIDAGGTVVFSETAEVIGGEHLLAERAVSREVADDFLAMVERFENSIEETGVDIRGAQPTPGNISSGLSTLEEKTMGAIVKTGTQPLMGVLEWGEHRDGKPGLYFMDGPCATNQMLLGMAATGAQIFNFNLGGGKPACIRTVPAAVGSGCFPILPVLKTLSNPTNDKESIWSDVFAGPIITGESSIEEKGEEFLSKVLKTASGIPTRLEIYQSPYREVWDFWTTGPTM